MARRGLVGLALAAALSACGGDDDEGKRVRPSPEDLGAPGQPAPERIQRVAIEDFRYRPDTISVPLGGPAEWVNRGDVRHTVTWRSGDGERFDSGTLKPGEEFMRTFVEPGTVRYQCTIHPDRMRGTVFVAG